MICITEVVANCATKNSVAVERESNSEVTKVKEEVEERNVNYTKPKGNPMLVFIECLIKCYYTLESNYCKK